MGGYAVLERIANKLTVTRDEGDQNSNSLDQLVANIESPNNSSNASFITEDPSTAYKDDPKIFHKDSKSIRMLSCKVPNAFVYENQQSGFKIGYVKVVSNSMGHQNHLVGRKMEGSIKMAKMLKNRHIVYAIVNIGSSM